MAPKQPTPYMVMQSANALPILSDIASPLNTAHASWQKLGISHELPDAIAEAPWVQTYSFLEDTEREVTLQHNGQT